MRIDLFMSGMNGSNREDGCDPQAKLKRPEGCVHLLREHCDSSAISMRKAR